MKVMDIYYAIRESGSNSDDPDNFMGWGIPDFELANSIVTTVEKIDKNTRDIAIVSPNPFKEFINIRINIGSAQEVDIKLRNMSGALLFQKNMRLNVSSDITSAGWDLSKLASGIYFLQVTTSEGVDVEQIIKH